MTCGCLCLPCLPAGGQGAITTDDVAQAVLFCFRLSKNAVPEEVGGEGGVGRVGGWGGGLLLLRMQVRVCSSLWG
jgi:hypothetical protein